MLELCMHCMEKLENNQDVCPKCGSSRNHNQPLPFISQKTIIGNRYVIGEGLHEDFEGLSYIGFDFIKNTKVYIRELFPSELCTRNSGGNVKIMDSPAISRKFNVLKENFLKYFRGIARLRNLSSFVAVYDILEQNNTAYIIMEWIDNGTSLDKFLSKNGGRLDWKSARILFMPLLSSLSKMESAGIHHLGISPSNIIVDDDNKLKLGGFATQNLRTLNTLISSELFDGCSALEQYIENADVSESTDIYGFTASLFFALTGEYPLSAVKRKKKDKLLMSSEILKELPENVVSAIANALRIYPNSRTISFETLRIELSDSPVLRVNNIYEAEEDFKVSTSNESSTNKWGIIACISSLLILIVCLAVYWLWIKDKSSNTEPIQEKNMSQVNLLEDTIENVEETKVDVPQLIGKTIEEAKRGVTSENDYSVVVLSEEFHDTIAEGRIISQTPSYGEKMYPGSTIAVNVSKGPEKRVLPSIMGRSLSEASLILSDAKFKPKQVSENNSKFPEGTVIGYQNYQAGDLVDYGAEVTIVVSKG